MAVSPFGFDSFIKFNQEPRKPGAGLAIGFPGFMVSRINLFIHSRFPDSLFNIESQKMRAIEKQMRREVCRWPGRGWAGLILVAVCWPLNWMLPGTRTSYL